ncbi:hypothetical protein L3X38_024013 [Prunus dulcis]|uniref:Uncharacterized protein n=1 Tax=Prunus dulcis TaxID=3755 RepID=A0AAD4VZT8_PRUDU|nr:hypothetical protein L3X38_024013 [Prunus dulcis]
MASSKAFLLLGLVFAVLLISFEVSAIPTQSEESTVNGDGHGHGGYGHGPGGYGHRHGGYGHGHHGKGGPGVAETEIKN